MLPLVTRAALEVIIIVPGALREAALALGAPQWRVVLRVVLPTARVGLITAAILGVARTAGETAEVLFTAGGNSHYNLNPVSGFQDDLPLRIYELINQPSLNAIREAWGIAFVLVAVVLEPVRHRPVRGRGRERAVSEASPPTQGARTVDDARQRSTCHELRHLTADGVVAGHVDLAPMSGLAVGLVATSVIAVDARPRRRRPSAGDAAQRQRLVVRRTRRSRQWDSDVSHSPYSLSVNYTSSSSGTGRYLFTNETVDFAVSDTGYVNSSVGTTPPSFPYEFIPITAAGVAFMYNVPGLTQTLQLTSYTACACSSPGQITNWDDPPSTQRRQRRGDTAQPGGQARDRERPGWDQLRARGVLHRRAARGVGRSTPRTCRDAPPSGVAISATTPGSNWEAPGNGYDEQTTSAVASTVANTAGAIGPVQENYAIDSGFTGSNPAKSVANVQNASGDFTAPNPVDVASALAYATQQANGTHVLDFNGQGPHVYNPSTYSYLLTPTTGWSKTKGAVMSAYVNYVLTLGQQEAPKHGLRQPRACRSSATGSTTSSTRCPGACHRRRPRSQGYSCGDLTPDRGPGGPDHAHLRRHQRRRPACTAGAPPRRSPTATKPKSTAKTSAATKGSGAGPRPVAARRPPPARAPAPTRRWRSPAATLHGLHRRRPGSHRRARRAVLVVVGWFARRGCSSARRVRRVE